MIVALNVNFSTINIILIVGKEFLKNILKECIYSTQFFNLSVEMDFFFFKLNNVMMEIEYILMDAIDNAKLKRIGQVILIKIYSQFCYLILMNFMIFKFYLHNKLNSLYKINKIQVNIFKPSIQNLGNDKYNIQMTHQNEVSHDQVIDLALQFKVLYLTPIEKPVFQIEFYNDLILSELNYPLIKSQGSIQLQTQIVLSPDQVLIAQQCSNFNDAIIISLGTLICLLFIGKLI
ncbi:unnamed protein product [Paramecium pentaurelia]|uniref:Transmembrane protein n=1 Tax=Paramecium pentaurelia TaxID=43138 RepID=A0A8S1UCF5_9CILI|nr:unnamed protein product [Paramecium pentaurelia]